MLFYVQNKKLQFLLSNLIGLIVNFFFLMFATVEISDKFFLPPRFHHYIVKAINAHHTLDHRNEIFSTSF